MWARERGGTVFCFARRKRECAIQRVQDRGVAAPTAFTRRVSLDSPAKSRA